MYVNCEIILSILVVSHNQENLLPRCIESILMQRIDFTYEIIISDDNSTDGTREIIANYEKQYPELIFGYFCNSDNCNPNNLSERCGYNKGNAYQYSRGKYFVNIDADDYLLGNDVYQKQVELLERHPECSMCMQNIWVLNNGDPIENGSLWKPGKTLATGAILNAKDFILQSLGVLNQGYMIRRNEVVNPVDLYGKHFDDTVITYHHLQFGSVVYIDKCDYIWVQYRNSINSSLRDDNRKAIINLLPIQHIKFIPKFSGLFLKNGLTELIHLLKLCSEKKMDIDTQTKVYLAEFNGFIFKYFQKSNPALFDTFRIYFIRMLLLSLKKWDIVSPLLYRLTYALITNYKEMLKIKKERWRIE